MGMFKEYIRKKRIGLHVVLVFVLGTFISISGVGLSSLYTPTVVQVSDQESVSNLVSNTEPEPIYSLILNSFVEFAQNSNPQFALNFAAFSFVLFLLIVSVALQLRGANVTGLFTLFIASLLNRNSKYGGIIYNGVSGKPIGLAKVSILRKEAVGADVAAIVVESGLTDLAGRYKLNSIPSRNLSIEVKLLGYEYFIKTLPSHFDVPLNPLREKSVPERILAIDKVNLLSILRLVTVIASIWGYIVAIYEQVASPSVANLILIAIYSVMFIIATYPSLYSLFLKRVFVIDAEKKKVMSAVIRIYEDNKLIDLDLTNKKGAAQFNIVEGTYKAVTTKPGYEYSEEQIDIGEEGNVKTQIILNTTNKVETIVSDLDLHDQVMQENHDKFNIH